MKGGQDQKEHQQKIEDARLAQERATWMPSEIAKQVEKRKLKGVRQVWSTHKKFVDVCLGILKKYNATENELKSFEVMSAKLDKDFRLDSGVGQ